MKLKRIIAVVLVAVCLLMLSGCVKMEVSIKVNSDGSAQMQMIQLLDVETWSSMGSVDEQIASIKEQGEAQGMACEEITREIDGKEWRGLSMTASGDGTSGFVAENYITKSEDGSQITFTIPVSELSSMSGASQVEDSGYDAQTLKSFGVEITVRIEMPGPATSNAGTVEGNVVTLDLLDSQLAAMTDDLVITSSASSGLGLGLILAVVGGCILVAAVVIILVVIRKKKNPTPPTMTPPADPSAAPSVDPAPEMPVEEPTTPPVETTVQEPTQDASDHTDDSAKM